MSILSFLVLSLPLYADLDGPSGHDVLCIVDTHPLTVRTTTHTLFVRPWRSSDWRELDVDEYAPCQEP